MATPYAQLLRELRTSRGYSQLEIAEKIGVSRSSYIALEQGTRELSLAEANELAKIYDIALADIEQGKIRKSAVVVQREGGEKSVRGDSAATVRVSVPQEKLEKFKQVLLYVLAKVGGRPNVGQTVLYKLLYFIDFDYYEKYETQLVGARYIKNTHGPTPVMFAKVIADLEAEGKLETIRSKFYKYDQTKYLVNPALKLDLSALSGQELAHIDWELARLSDHTASQISALSHKDTPWLVADEREELHYEHVFYRPEETSVREYEPL